jgi:hypothetical protein
MDLVPRLAVEEPGATDTPRSSFSESRSPLQLHDPPQEISTWPNLVGIERPKSASDEQIKEHHDSWYPRRLSFSIAQDAIETWYPPENNVVNAGHIPSKLKGIDWSKKSTLSINGLKIN